MRIKELKERIEFLERRIRELESKESVIVFPVVQFDVEKTYFHPWEPKVFCEGLTY